MVETGEGGVWYVRGRKVVFSWGEVLSVGVRLER